MSRQINLFDPALRLRREWLTLPRLVGGLALMLLGILLAGGLVRQGLPPLQRSAAESHAQLEVLRARLLAETRTLAQHQQDPKLKAELETEEKQLARVRLAMSQIQGSIQSQARPFGEVFKALARSRQPGVWLVQVEVVRGGRLALLEGRARHESLIPPYVAGLRQEAALRGLGFGVLQLRPGAGEEAGPEGDALRHFVLAGQPEGGETPEVPGSVGRP
jgi:hypothetical protein